MRESELVGDVAYDNKKRNITMEMTLIMTAWMVFTFAVMKPYRALLLHLVTIIPAGIYVLMMQSGAAEHLCWVAAFSVGFVGCVLLNNDNHKPTVKIKS